MSQAEKVKFHPDSKYEYDREFLKQFNIAAGHDGAMWGKGRGLPDEPYFPGDSCGVAISRVVELVHDSEGL